MRIEDIDRNFIVETDITEPDLVWFNIKEAPFVIYGVSFEESEGRYTRMPRAAAEQVSPGVVSARKLTSGGRVRFKTDSSYIAIKAVQKNVAPTSHMTWLGHSGFDLYHKKRGKDVYYFSFMPPIGMTQGYSSGKKTDGKYTDYTINFPGFDGVSELYVALKKGARLSAPTPYKTECPVVFYGSSITHGGCASRPGNTYPAMISRELDINFINLGFSGKAKGEPGMADYIASLDMSAFVLDYDHNTSSEQHLIDTHEPFFKKVRAAHPDMPIVIVSAPNTKLQSSMIYAGHGSFCNRRDIIRKTYENAVAAGDKNVYFVDGFTLFSGKHSDACTVDGIHPNDLGFYRMSQVIGKVLKKVLTAKEQHNEN